MFGGITTLLTHKLTKKRQRKQLEMAVSVSPSVANKQKLAEFHINNGDHAQAVDAYRLALSDRFNQDPELLMGLAQAYILQEKWDSALEVLTNMIKDQQNPKTKQAQLMTAQVFELKQDHEQALATYQQIYLTYPGLEASYRYTKLLRQTGAIEQAKEIQTAVMYKYAQAPKHIRAQEAKWIDLFTTQQSVES